MKLKAEKNRIQRKTYQKKDMPEKITWYFIENNSLTKPMHWFFKKKKNSGISHVRVMWYEHAEKIQNRKRYYKDDPFKPPQKLNYLT